MPMPDDVTLIPPTPAPIADNAWKSRRPGWVTAVAVEMLIIGLAGALLFGDILKDFISTKEEGDALLVCMDIALFLCYTAKFVFAIQLFRLSNKARIISIYLLGLVIATLTIFTLIEVFDKPFAVYKCIMLLVIIILDLLPLIILTRRKIAATFQQ